ncbi:hypothetical protein HUT18_32980 [Streptomyces sp. NA04227]|uniref:hypothetical protein n=1 Tax=Streptomyces sp. NA04227 TaxID=2742136 RepID=UPI0015901047|nr:hypothetical protein [Streptomyces sp. NA04227]QKW10520.1 hypothetical protein HUT18_32980 [Streptomyces sp. NA04227]
MTNGSGDPRRGQAEEAVQIVAGLVDLGLEQAEGLIRRMRGVLGRSDLDVITADGREDLRARGELALKRHAPTAESHMETLARQVAARRSGSGA